MTRGYTAGPEERSGGRSGAPRALQFTPVSFFNCTTHREKSQDTQQKSQRYSANFTLLSQKQRRYAYDIHVYDKIVPHIL